MSTQGFHPQFCGARVRKTAANVDAADGRPDERQDGVVDGNLIEKIKIVFDNEYLLSK